MKTAVIDKNKERNRDWDLVIEPRRAWWDLRLGQLWRYRDLIMLFVRRDFVATYKQTILGPLSNIPNGIHTLPVSLMLIGSQLPRL